MTAIIIFKQMAILFAIMIVGYFCFKKQWLDKNSYGKLSKIVVNIMNPMLIIGSVINKEVGSDIRKIWYNLLLAVLYFAMLTLISFVVVRILKIDRAVESLYRLMMIFSNVGFIAIPVIGSVYGEEIVLYIAFYILGYNLLLYSYGYILVGQNVQYNMESTGTKHVKARLPWSKIMNSGVISCLIAILIFALQIKIPDYLASFVDYMGEPAVPLSMILIGASMAQQELGKLFKDIKMYLFLVVRMLLIPIIAALLIKQFPIPDDIAGVFVFMLSMPVGSIVVLLAADQGADETCCTKGSILSTFFAVLTIPIVALFL